MSSVDTVVGDPTTSEPDRVQEPAQHDIRVEDCARDGSRGPAMALVVALDRVDAGQEVPHRLEREQSLARGQVGAESRLLQEHGPAGGEVARAAVAEPSGPRHDITA